LFGAAGAGRTGGSVIEAIAPCLNGGALSQSGAVLVETSGELPPKSRTLSRDALYLL
jgi:hypothetical protein